jgi:hypothetical protein
VSRFETINAPHGDSQPALNWLLAEYEELQKPFFSLSFNSLVHFNGQRTTSIWYLEQLL